MNVVEAIVVFSVTWFIVFFVMLAMPFETQGEQGEVVPGTPRSAPSNIDIKRRAKITTLIALVVWAVIAWIVTSGVITIRDLDVFNKMNPPAEAVTEPATAPATGGGTGG